MFPEKKKKRSNKTSFFGTSSIDMVLKMLKQLMLKTLYFYILNDIVY